MIDCAIIGLGWWGRHLAGRAPYPFTREPKMHNIAVLEAIIRSDLSGEPVQVCHDPIDRERKTTRLANSAARPNP